MSGVQLQTRRDFPSLAGKGLGLAALLQRRCVMLKNVESAIKMSRFPTDEAAMNEIIGPSSQIRSASARTIHLTRRRFASPRDGNRIAGALHWEQEDALPTRCSLPRPQCETLRTGWPNCSVAMGEIAIRAMLLSHSNSMDGHGHQGRRLNSHDNADTPQLTNARQREKREGLTLKLIQIPLRRRTRRDTAAFEKGSPTATGDPDIASDQYHRSSRP